MSTSNPSLSLLDVARTGTNPALKQSVFFPLSLWGKSKAQGQQGPPSDLQSPTYHTAIMTWTKCSCPPPFPSAVFAHSFWSPFSQSLLYLLSLFLSCFSPSLCSKSTVAPEASPHPQWDSQASGSHHILTSADLDHWLLVQSQ